MKLDVDPFPANINMINFEEKRVLVQTSQASSTQGKNVIVSDETVLRCLLLSEKPQHRAFHMPR
jgi:hypothetical protein